MKKYKVLAPFWSKHKDTKQTYRASPGEEYDATMESEFTLGVLLKRGFIEEIGEIGETPILININNMEELKKEVFEKFMLIDSIAKYDLSEDVRQWVESKLAEKDARISTLIDVIAKDKRPTIEEIVEEAKPKRQYPSDVPNPETQPEEFNEYLRKNNEVVDESHSWILIKNSYVENQLVAFCKIAQWGTKPPKKPKYITDIAFLTFGELQDILKNNNLQDKHIYINADKEKSIPNRLHIHIKL